MQDNQTKTAYAECLRQARGHYENFPTASRIVEKKHRDATAAIYSFARRADDIADEGNKSAAQRHEEMGTFSSMLSDIEKGQPVSDPTFIALADTITRYKLPFAPFQNLLTAFSMDIDKKRFINFDELLFYCRHSANPVGELILRLHALHNAATQTLSDSICTALQLINFLQDIDEDYRQRDRIYIPQDEMLRYGINEADIQQQTNTANLCKLVDFQLERASSMLISGVPLINKLHGRLKWVIKLTITSALLICEKLAIRSNVFERPALTRADWLKIALRSIYFRPHSTHAKILLMIKRRMPHG